MLTQSCWIALYQQMWMLVEEILVLNLKIYLILLSIGPLRVFYICLYPSLYILVLVEIIWNRVEVGAGGHFSVPIVLDWDNSLSTFTEFTVFILFYCIYYIYLILLYILYLSYFTVYTIFILFYCIYCIYFIFISLVVTSRRSWWLYWL